MRYYRGFKIARSEDGLFTAVDAKNRTVAESDSVLGTIKQLQDLIRLRQIEDNAIKENCMESYDSLHF